MQRTVAYGLVALIGVLAALLGEFIVGVLWVALVDVPKGLSGYPALIWLNLSDFAVAAFLGALVSRKWSADWVQAGFIACPVVMHIHYAQVRASVGYSITRFEITFWIVEAIIDVSVLMSAAWLFRRRRAKGEKNARGFSVGEE